MLLIGFDKISEPSLTKRPEGLFTAATLETIGLFNFFSIQTSAIDVK